MAEFTRSHIIFHLFLNNWSFALAMCVCVCVHVYMCPSHGFKVIDEKILGKLQVVYNLKNTVMIIPILGIQCQLKNDFSGQQYLQKWLMPANKMVPRYPKMSCVPLIVQRHRKPFIS